MSSTTMMRPSRFETIFSYRGSACTSAEASRAVPDSRPRNTPGCTVSSGKKVARPAWSLRNRAMAAFAAASFSTTMFCSAPPSAVSMATSHPGSTFRMVDTGPRTPRRRRAPAARMTARTEFW